MLRRLALATLALTLFTGSLLSVAAAANAANAAALQGHVAAVGLAEQPVRPVNGNTHKPGSFVGRANHVQPGNQRTCQPRDWRVGPAGTNPHRRDTVDPGRRCCDHRHCADHLGGSRTRPE